MYRKSLVAALFNKHNCAFNVNHVRGPIKHYTRYVATVVFKTEMIPLHFSYLPEQIVRFIGHIF